MARHYEIIENVIRKNNFRIIAEVGVNKGNFMKKILRSKAGYLIKEYWAIDQWAVLGDEHGRMSKYTQDDWDDRYKKVVACQRYFSQLKVVRMNSVQASNLFWKKYFDIVYLDASHFYYDVKEDISAWIGLVRPGGAISGHDYGTGAKKNHNVAKAADELIGKENITLYDDGVWIHYV